MADQPGTLEQIALALAKLLQPLEELAGDGDPVRMLGRFGIRLPGTSGSDPALTAALTYVVSAAGRLEPGIDKLTTAIDAGDAGQIVPAGIELVKVIGEVIHALTGVASALGSVGASSGLAGPDLAAVQELADTLPKRIFDLLLVELLRGAGQNILPALTLSGIVEDAVDPGTHGNPARPPYRRRAVHLDRLLDAISDPVTYLETAFGFGQPAFDGALLFAPLKQYLDEIDFPVTLIEVTGQPTVLEAFLFRLSTDQAASPPKLTGRLRLAATTDVSVPFPLRAPWSGSIDAKLRFDEGIDAAIAPPLSVELSPPTGGVSGELSASLVADAGGEPMVIFGQAGASRLELKRLAITPRLDVSVDDAGHATTEPAATVEVTGGRLVIDMSESDGFIATITGGTRIDSNIDLKALWSPSGGLHFEGSSAIEIAVPTHVSLGPIDIQSLYVSAGVSNTGIPIELSGAFKASLGPLQVSIDRIGVQADISFPSGGGGNLGPAQLDLSFKPPTGVGLSVDAGIVSGGGFLYIDSARGEYAGALQLEFADFLTLSAIGLINTKMPDGSPGFSLLIIITADFGAGFQLGFGFTLNAVGGLLGVNRAMLFDPLMAAMRSNAIESIMFPRDVVANAPRIISDLKAIFPPQPPTFLIGPMAKLGWGEPTLVSLSLGVIIEIPPGDVAILGVLKVALPADEVAVVVLQVNFAGALEFSKSRLYFFASLYDSHILFITLEGEMGLLFAWGDDADFVLSVGGFHPQFSPPPLPFPTPKRIAVDIINESYARIHCDGYFAVTTNTVQFGSHSEFFFGFSALSVSGHSGFDALIQFSPFHFIVEISTSFSVKVFGIGVYGIDIDLTVEGPTPWHVHGSASLSFFFFSVDIPIDFTFGDAPDTTLPPIAVMPILGDELGKQVNWRAVLPSGSNLLVALRSLAPAESQFVLHPVGTLQVSQRAVPLDLTIDKLGASKPSDANRFSLKVSSSGLAKTRDLDESFAPAQFKNLDDASKLSLPAYQPQHGGIELAASSQAYASGTAICRIVRYDVTIIDTKLLHRQSRFVAYSGALFQFGLRLNAAARSPLSARLEAKVRPFDGAVSVNAETYVVANVADNTVFHPDAASFTSKLSALEFMSDAAAADPSLHETVHVIPMFEAVL